MGDIIVQIRNCNIVKTALLNQGIILLQRNQRTIGNGRFAEMAAGTILPLYGLLGKRVEELTLGCIDKVGSELIEPPVRMVIIILFQNLLCPILQLGQFVIGLLVSICLGAAVFLLTLKLKTTDSPSLNESTHFLPFIELRRGRKETRSKISTLPPV